jgi:hypothetical protein
MIHGSPHTAAPKTDPHYIAKFASSLRPIREIFQYFSNLRLFYLFTHLYFEVGGQKGTSVSTPAANILESYLGSAYPRFSSCSEVEP